MPAVEWSNGHIDQAASWQALLDRVRAAQWADMTEEQFRTVLGKRAWRWAAVSIDVFGDPEELFHELQRAKLLFIIGDAA